MFTTTHLITLLSIGAIVSGGIFAIVEYWARKFPKIGGEKSAGESKFRRRAPLVLGVLISLWGFPASFAIVVKPIALEPWWHLLLWGAAGIFAGLVAGICSRGAYDIAQKMVQKVSQ